ncbi:MAG: glycosyltransferase family 4 protein [Thermoplasmata archaeon]|nr:glycosyltransferase family 4 protein [Thermoplasmata archaeon]
MHIVLAGTGVLPIPPTGYGGVERTIGELAEALRARGETVTVLNEVRRGRSSDEYRFALGLKRQLRALEYDVVHASTPAVANGLAWSGLPYVYTTHSRHWFERESFGARWGYFLEKRAVRHSAGPIALTDRLRTEIARRVPSAAGALQVIPIGVDVGRFRPDWPSRTGRRALGVGVVRPFKRWELAARALQGTGISLRIVGPTPDLAYADRVRAAGDGVEIVGEIPEPDLARAFAESDLLVHPSRVELLAGAVVQGLAAGLPILGAAPVADLVEPGTGACAPAAATDEEIVAFLRAHATAYAADPALRRSTGEAARAVAERRFSWARVAEAHVDLYRQVARAAGPTRRRTPGS